MKVCILYYDGFCEFETVLTALLFKEHYVSAGLDDRVYVSEEKQRFVPDMTLNQLDPKEVDLFFIPGGDPSPLFGNPLLREYILELNSQGKLIAGICGGTYLMAACGILDGKRCTGNSSGLAGTELPWFSKCNVCSDDIVVEGNLVTAAGQAYLELAVTLARLAKLYPDDRDYDDVLRWFKNIK